jgi:hypothetical protein
MSEQLLSRSSDLELVHIRKRIEQLNTDYQLLKSERHRLTEWEEDQPFSILGEIEVFTTQIQGYAYQILSQKMRSSIEETIQHLKAIKLFEIDYFSDWYFAETNDYTQLKRYVEAQDYLRLLLLEYLNQTQSHPVLQ